MSSPNFIGHQPRRSAFLERLLRGVCAHPVARFGARRRRAGKRDEHSGEPKCPGTIGDGGFSASGQQCDRVRLEAREGRKRRLARRCGACTDPRAARPRSAGRWPSRAGSFSAARRARPKGKPSILGGFGWYAENGSYAHSASGGNLHLLDDDLRVKFGVGYMDVQVPLLRHR